MHSIFSAHVSLRENAVNSLPNASPWDEMQLLLVDQCVLQAFSAVFLEVASTCWCHVHQEYQGGGSGM